MTYTISLWCSNLWDLLYFWHFEQWAWHKNVEWPYFQQLWYWKTPGFMLVALMVAMDLPKLKEWFISSFALDLFWESQISNQMIAISDLEETLMTLGLATRVTDSNSFIWLMTLKGEKGNLTVISVTNFIQSYLYQFFDDSHSLNSTRKPLKRPFDLYQSCLEENNIGRAIEQISR